jgi:hypothetical protein
VEGEACNSVIKVPRTNARTGLSQHTIEAIRAGKRVRRTTLKRLESALALR